MESKEQELFAFESEKAKELSVRLGFGVGIFQGLSNFALNGLILGVLYGGSYLITSQEISPGDLMAFMVTSQTIQRSLAQFSLLMGQAVRGMSASARIFEVFFHFLR